MNREEEFKSNNFNDIEDLIKTCKMWIRDEDWDALGRWFDLGALEELINYIEKQQKQIKEISKKYVDLCFEAGKIKADLDIAERVIDKMADYIAKREIEEVNKNSITIKELWNKSSPEKSIYDLVKEYFYKEIE